MRSDAQPLTWRPALYGLRAIAVIGVMLYHHQTRTWFPGGLFGVDLFFVLSGFLITTLLIEEWHRAETISLIGFFRRHFIRLAPALAVFLVAYTALVFALSGHDTVDNLTGAEALQNALRP